MKNPNWEELTEKLLNYYEMSLAAGKDDTRNVRKEIIAIGRLLDESEKSLTEATQELEKQIKWRRR